MISPLYLCGTTATGKSEVARTLAKELGGEVINADAFQIYAGLEILTAAPSYEVQAEVQHHLYGTLPLQTALSAAHYERLARPLIAEVSARGKLPIVTGGSGLYLKALTHRLSPLPASDPLLRAQLEARPAVELYEELQSIDPESLETFPAENTRYLVRALEICLLSGQKASALKQDWNTLPTPPPRGILLERPKEETLDSIERRAHWMMQNGVLGEVKRALKLQSTVPTASKAIGMREITSYLRGETNYDECLERLIIRTRQYAKRQRTWFRKEGWLSSFHPEEIDKITAYAIASQAS